MTQGEIKEGNKLIAHFMDYEERYDEHGVWQPLQYHSSWDWLMPVVDKIIDIDITPAPNWRGYRIEIVPRGYVKIEGFPMPTITTNVSIEGSLINAIYSAVVRFIQWYNKQK